MAAPFTCDLSILIVSWNVRDLLHGCLRSLARASRPIVSDPTLRCFGPSVTQVEQHAAGPPTPPRRGPRAPAPEPPIGPTLEVIVVDNASHDGTAEMVRSTFPWVRLIEAGANLGFTRGNNRAFAASRGAFVYFLNPDTELLTDRLHGDGLELLYDAVRANPGVALAGPRLRNADNSLQPSARRFPTPVTGFFESTWLGQAWPRNPWARRLRMDDWRVSFAHDVDWVTGAAMLARRDALLEVTLPGMEGPFDEAYFMYSEELDLCRRLKARGWRILYVPRAQVIHLEGRSSDQAVAARHLHFNTSKVRYWQIWFGPRWSEALRRYLLLEYRVQIALERGKWLLGHKRDLRKQRIAVYKQVLASRLRPAE